MSAKPRINEEFPIKGEDQLSPPIVGRPINQCAEVVSVSGFIPHATVRVYSNQNDLVGEDAPPFGFSDIHLKRPLRPGESITATQTVENHTSTHSIRPVIVSNYLPGGHLLPKPVVAKDIFQCGRVVPVGELVPSATVHVFEDGNEIGAAATTGTGCSVVTKALHANGKVTAQQIVCERSNAHTLKSPESDPVPVQPAPSPVPSPVIDKESLVVGNDTVTLTNLYCGANVTVLDKGTAVGGGLATGSANWCPIEPPLQSTSVIKGIQELCQPSPPSDEAKPELQLHAPVVVGPICQGARFVLIRKTVINANVILRRGGHIIGYGGAMPGDLLLAIGGNVQLAAGDKITAIQTMGATISPASNTVTVVSGLRVPVIDVTGGESFFLPEVTDQAIDGPVFPRGRGSGPLVKIQACCTKSVEVSILGPNGEVVAQLKPDELYPGYYTARWDWQSAQGWRVPSEVPVGAYTVVVKTGCEQKEGRAKFYVIFNPDDVNGPPRFSFNKTAVWFYSPANSDRAILFHLHTNDARVFSMAISGASGMADPRKAAEALSKAVSNRFVYSVSVAHTDAIQLLEDSSKLAQCADEACFLTALLRSIGIPAHPVTADANIEGSAIRWSFDTWTEFLTHVPGGTEWLVLHPHEYPNDPAMSRQTFGTTRDVATNASDDLIIMANESWAWDEASDSGDDVTFSRNACGQPEEQIDSRPWVDHICEQGYWDIPHWQCSRTRSLIRAPLGLRLEGPALRHGGELAGILALENGGGERIVERITVEIVSHRPEVKGFIEESLDATSHRLTLEPGRDLTVPFQLHLPARVAPGYELYLRAAAGEQTLLLQMLRLPSAIASELRMPRELRVGEEFTVTALVRNLSHQAVRGISLTLDMPYAILVRDGREAQPLISSEPRAAAIESLPPGNERVIEWKAQAVASLEAGTVRLEVGSQDGGSSVSAAPVRVLGSDAPPALRTALLARPSRAVL